MEPAETLHGRVTNSKGEPIEGVIGLYRTAALSGLPVTGFAAQDGQERRIQDHRFEGWARPKDAGQFMAINSRKGNTGHGSLGAGLFRRSVVASGLWLKMGGVPRLPGELNVQLPEVGSVTGRAIDATTKAPLAGVLVHAEAPSQRRPATAGDFRAGTRSNWAITDRDGNYRLALRAGNDYQVFSNFEGFLPTISSRIRDCRRTRRRQLTT